MMREMVLLPNPQENPENVNSTRDLSFTVLNNGEPLANANVYIGGEDVSSESVTGSAGGCTIKGIPDGTYEIQIWKPSTDFALSDEITVSQSNTSFTFDFNDYNDTTQQEPEG